jgi:hypothetical protein
MAPSLYTVHRLLIRVFVAAAAVFAFAMLRRWWSDRNGVDLACGIGGLIVALGALAYLVRAPYLKRK